MTDADLKKVRHRILRGERCTLTFNAKNFDKAVELFDRLPSDLRKLITVVKEEDHA